MNQSKLGKHFPSGSGVKNLPTMWEVRVRSLGWEDPLEKGMATHSSILAQRVPWTEEPGGLQTMESQRAGHDWATNTDTHTSLVNVGYWGGKIKIFFTSFFFFFSWHQSPQRLMKCYGFGISTVLVWLLDTLPLILDWYPPICFRLLAPASDRESLISITMGQQHFAVRSRLTLFLLYFWRFSGLEDRLLFLTYDWKLLFWTFSLTCI